jgi:tRNA pseudouridine38-40 synthase
MVNSEKIYRMRIAYDGTTYSGWQIQPNSSSIQGVIEQALHKLLKAPIRLIGAGRTDAGVHAIGQTAHFTTLLPLDCSQMLYALNGILPRDIRIKEFVPTTESFHAQYGALSKEYHYHLWLEKVIDPFQRLDRHHFHDTRFQLSLLKEGLELFIGTHDFTTFANVGGAVNNHIRTIKRITLQHQEGGIRLEFEGNGFLYKMVRNIVGTLLEVATSKKPVAAISTLFAQKDRRFAGPAAPARGLFLMAVNYGEIPAVAISTKEEKCLNSFPSVETSSFTSVSPK